MLSIVQFVDWPTASIEELLVESEQEGFRFLRRAQEEWLSSANRFSKEGEALFGIFEAERLLAIGGVTRETETRGRLRRFYVRGDERRRGIGRQLVQHVLAFSRGHYACVVLRCDTDAADQFYRALGFSHVTAEAGSTHRIELGKKPDTQ